MDQLLCVPALEGLVIWSPPLYDIVRLDSSCENSLPIEPSHHQLSSTAADVLCTSTGGAPDILQPDSSRLRNPHPATLRNRVLATGTTPWGNAVRCVLQGDSSFLIVCDLSGKLIGCPPVWDCWTLTCTCSHAHAHTHTYAHTRARVHTHTHTICYTVILLELAVPYTYSHMHTHTHTYTCMYTTNHNTHAHAHHTHTHTPTHTHAHAHAHTHTHTCSHCTNIHSCTHMLTHTYYTHTHIFTGQC